LKLLAPSQRLAGWEIDFDETGILRGSLRQRLEAFEIARRIGYLSQEEIREIDGLPAPNEQQNFTMGPKKKEKPDEMPHEMPNVEDTQNPGNDPAQQLDSQKRLSRWFRDERHRLLDFADDPKTFQWRVDSFYELTADKVAAMVGELDVDDWTAGHRLAVLEASECQPADLRDRVDELTRDWPTISAAEIAGLLTLEN